MLSPQQSFALPLWASIVILTLAASPATAQTAGFSVTENSPAIFARSGVETVASRSQPEYDPHPVRIGTFLLSAEAALSTTGIDNVLATENNRIGDNAGTLSAETYVASDWGLHALRLSAAGAATRYAYTTSENNETFGAAIEGRYDLRDATNIQIGADARRLNLSRLQQRSLLGTRAPISYGQYHAYIGAVGSTSHFRFAGWVDQLAVRYIGQRVIGDVPSPYVDKDRTAITARVDFASMPDLIVFQQSRVRIQSYQRRATVPIRDTTETELTLGIDAQRPGFLLWTVSGGWLRERFSNPRYRDYTGFAFHIAGQYALTPIVTLSLIADRSFEDTPILNVAGVVVDTAQGTADYEYRRNIKLSASLGYTRETYRGIGLTRRLVSGSVSARYAISPHFSIDASAGHNARSASGNDSPFSYTVNRVTLSLTAHL